MQETQKWYYLRRRLKITNITENIELTDNGKKVIIPRELWDEVVEVL